MATTAISTTVHTDRDRETEQLFERLHHARTGKDARAVTERIALLYLDLCTTMASRYGGRGVEHDDLVQVARLALVAAIRRYRPGRGPSFAAFAVPTISGELKRHFRDRAWLVRPPRRLQELRAAVITQRERFEQLCGRAPTEAELADALSASAADVREASVAAQGFRPVAIDTSPVVDRVEPSLERHLSCRDGAIDSAAEWVTLEEALHELGDADRWLLGQRFVRGLTQREIGERLGVSQMQVSRALRRVLDTLRERLDGPDGPDDDVAASA
jgi:RNA polymerase sigma-B factor